MIDCLIVGDSIARGTHYFRPECALLAKSGINSRDWNRQWPRADLGATTVIISLGSNDHRAIRTIWELQAIRRRVQADRVFWILPAIKPDIQNMVRLVACDYGDTVLPIERVSADGVHPTVKGYRALALETRNDE